MKRYGRVYNKKLGEGMVEMTMYVVKHKYFNKFQASPNAECYGASILRDTIYEPNRSAISSPARTELKTTLTFFLRASGMED